MVPKVSRVAKYRLIRDWVTELEKVAEKEVASFHSSNDIVPVDSLHRNARCLQVFDDVMLKKQRPVEKYFTMGRHGGADCFYLTQNYFCIPEQAIRDNSNLNILFNQDSKKLRSIHDTVVGDDMPFDEFRTFSANAPSYMDLR